MIKYVEGNLFESKSDALVNTVNTVGVMGKGIALQFKKLFPNNYKEYKYQCDKGQFDIGQLIVTEDQNITTGKKIIINFPTKTHWRKPSEYDFIVKGLDALISVIKEYNIKSIAIPPLGSGNGGLKWSKVKTILETKLSQTDGCAFYIYEPNSAVKEILNKERVKLTPARGMLLYMLFELVKNGEFVSEFASEKLCYFLQRFGAQKHFKLDFKANFYGPYSGKVRHVLNHLNGSYISGYASKDKKPFEELNLFIDSESQIREYIESNDDLKKIVEDTNNFLRGYYSAFGLELLSTVDFIASSNFNSDTSFIKEQLVNWSDRKKTLFANEGFIDKSIQHLKNYALVN